MSNLENALRELRQKRSGMQKETGPVYWTRPRIRRRVEIE
jgi:hypothetical protein